MENPCKELWYEERIKELETNLAKAVEGLKYYAWVDDDQGVRANQLLKDLGYKFPEDKQ